MHYLHVVIRHINKNCTVASPMRNKRHEGVVFVVGDFQYHYILHAMVVFEDMVFHSDALFINVCTCIVT